MRDSNRIRSSVKPATRPTTTSRLLFDSGHQRAVRGFGSAILPYVPHCGSRPYTVADEAWWAEESNQPERLQHAAVFRELRAIEEEEFRHLEEMCQEAEWLEMLENGANGM